MTSTNDTLFGSAILAEQQVTCTYDGRHRNLCPRIIGTNRSGEEAVLAWQLTGESSGPLPQWRCVRLANISMPAPPSGRWHAGKVRPVVRRSSKSAGRRTKAEFRHRSSGCSGGLRLRLTRPTERAARHRGGRARCARHFKNSRNNRWSSSLSGRAAVVCAAGDGAIDLACASDADARAVLTSSHACAGSSRSQPCNVAAKLTSRHFG